MRRAGAAATLLLATCGAQAETLTTTLSSEKVGIASNFTGAEIAVFGQINRDGGTVARAAGYDVVVSVRGPKGTVVVREKKPFALGLFWLNLDQRKYIAIPAFISVLSNRPLSEISTPELRARWHIGVDNLVPAQGDRTKADFAMEPEFRVALARLRVGQNLFGEHPKAVTFIGTNLFRANVLLPGTVPLGRYEVDVALFVEGAQLATSNASFTVTKSGVEQTITGAARDNALAYGFGASMFALFAGWLASVVFRRD